MLLRTALTGPFPRAEALVTATRDLDRGRTSADAVDELFTRTEAEVVRLEERLELSCRTGGFLRSADLFRSIATSYTGFTVGPLTRWFETNSFFRQPVLHAPPDRPAGVFAAAIPGGVDAGRALVLLPGPYTLAGLLENRSGETTEALTHRLGRLLGQEVAELRQRGYASFLLHEPLLVTRPPSGPLAEATVEAYRQFAAGAQGATTIVWTYFGDAAPAFPLLGRLPVTVIGVDLAETDAERLGPLTERKAIGLGIIDPRTTLIEEASDIARLARTIGERLRPTAIWLGPGASLDLLPWEPATRKLHVLAAARQALAGWAEAS